MLNKVLRYLNNYFYRFKESGSYKIQDGKIKVKGDYIQGQYIKVQGSYFNDKVIKIISVEEKELTLESVVDENFEGVIYSLAIPTELLELVTEIEEFETNNKKSIYTSESFGNYSYSKNTNKDGNVATWKDVFAVDLRGYRKIYSGEREVEIID